MTEQISNEASVELWQRVEETFVPADTWCHTHGDWFAGANSCGRECVTVPVFMREINGEPPSAYGQVPRMLLEALPSPSYLIHLRASDLESILRTQEDRGKLAVIVRGAKIVREPIKVTLSTGPVVAFPLDHPISRMNADQLRIEGVVIAGVGFGDGDERQQAGTPQDAGS